MSVWEERAARNEALFREVNEKILAHDDRLGQGDRTAVFVCECADGNCVTRLTVPLEVYTAVRSASRRFIVAPGHEDPQVETVVDRYHGYLIVEKRGAAGRFAQRSDPRDNE